MKELEFNVNGMECVGCENRIKNALSKVEEIKEVTASHETGKVTVTLKEENEEDIKTKIIQTIENLDFEVEA